MTDTDIRDTDPGYRDTQHCTAVDCLTFSHTARYCGNPQPRRCGCPFDYPEGATSAEAEMKIQLEELVTTLRDRASDRDYTSAPAAYEFAATELEFVLNRWL